MSAVESRGPDRKPHIVLFSGGTACRTINIALCGQPVDLTRIVPAWDSGGSSKVLRERFDMLPVGDVRQALMTMAHGEGQAGDVVKICNARLSDQLGQSELRTEFDYFADGKHPLLQRMAPDIRDAILNYLGLFKAELSPDFDFRTGSIGNFILTGAYLAHGRNINRAITVFRKLCSIAGNVWPVSTRDDVQLAATLGNGKHLARQHLITRMDDADSASGVAELSIDRRRSQGLHRGERGGPSGGFGGGCDRLRSGQFLHQHPAASAGWRRGQGDRRQPARAKDIHRQHSGMRRDTRLDLGRPAANLRR